MGPEHAARLAAGGAGGLGRGEDSDAGRDAGRARDRRPDAPGSGGAVDDRERGLARGAQDPALRRQAARARCRRRQRDRAEDQDAGQRAAARGRDRDGRASGAGPITRRARGFLLKPFRHGDVAARRPRPVRRAGARARSGIASTGRLFWARRCRRRCGRWRRRISATAPRRCWISANGRFSTPT